MKKNARSLQLSITALVYLAGGVNLSNCVPENCPSGCCNPFDQCIASKDQCNRSVGFCNSKMCDYGCCVENKCGELNECINIGYIYFSMLVVACLVFVLFSAVLIYRTFQKREKLFDILDDPVSNTGGRKKLNRVYGRNDSKLMSENSEADLLVGSKRRNNGRFDIMEG